jgi:transposase, IS6 family
MVAGAPLLPAPGAPLNATDPNNPVEPDHRRIQRRTRPRLGFGSFRTARRTLAGVEAMAMLAKGQVRATPANNVPAQRAFVHQIFGLAA